VPGILQWPPAPLKLFPPISHETCVKPVIGIVFGEILIILCSIAFFLENLFLLFQQMEPHLVFETPPPVVFFAGSHSSNKVVRAWRLMTGCFFLVFPVRPLDSEWMISPTGWVGLPGSKNCFAVIRSLCPRFL